MLDEALHGRVRGAVERHRDRWVVILNSADSRGRARFTLAHEIGHILLWEQREARAGVVGGAAVDPRSCRSAHSAEALCDRFAAELLMPAHAVHEAWRALGSVDAVARRFDVSRAAAARRLRELGLRG